MRILRGRNGNCADSRSAPGSYIGGSPLESKPMKQQPQLEFSDVKRIAAAAEAHAIAKGWTVSIAIVDAGGHLLWLQRLDGAAPISAQIAPAKAHTSAL